MNTRIIVALLLVLMGCSEDTKIVQVLPNTEASNGLIAGAWQHSTGELFADVTYLQLDADGRGMVYSERQQTGVLRCEKIIYAVLNDTTVTVGTDDGNQTYFFEKNSGSITLSDGNNVTHTFNSVVEVPAVAKCKNFSQVSVDADLQVKLSGFTGLAYDGSLLWFGTDDTAPYTIIPYDPASGELGTPIEFSYYRHIHAADGESFWGHCGCGGSPEAALYDKTNTQIDMVRTDIDLGNSISIRNIAWDGSYLWLHGSNRASGEREFLKIDSDAEPDVLVEVHAFNEYLNGLTWDGTYFWAIAGNSIIKVNPSSFIAVETYNSPSTVYNWLALEYVGPELYLLGTSNLDGSPAIAEVTP